MTISPSEARRRALLSAAKATLSLSVVGCGPSAPPASSIPSEQVSVGDQPAAARGAEQPLRPAGPGSPGSGATCDTTPREAYSKESLRCCRAVVDEVNERMKAAYQSKPYEPPVLTPLQQDCCSLAIDAVDHQPDTELGRSNVYTCCMFGRDEGRPWTPVARSSQAPTGHVCSPWGPPMPPALPAHLRASDAERSSTMSVLA